jgi:hypothetical protein
MLTIMYGLICCQESMGTESHITHQDAESEWLVLQWRFKAGTL